MGDNDASLLLIRDVVNEICEGLQGRWLLDTRCTAKPREIDDRKSIVRRQGRSSKRLEYTTVIAETRYE